ncbi:MAG TPA: lamin tail domain-containing protein, partial [Candidatus Udaeobacter sp.]|nr:lamin tail domain-containing protein [Candidatus Udaeobacter sp.]
MPGAGMAWSLCLGLWVTLVAPPAMGNPLVALNEVLADPARDWDGDSTVNAANDEWVEIVNTGAVPADLSELRLGDSERVWAYGFSGTLPVGGKIVVYGSTSKTWQTANGLSAFGLRLSNTGDTIVLWQLAAADTTILDQFTF